jgi:hypothetical protein
MRLIDLSSGLAILEVSKEELEMISNSINEVCHGIDIEEFETRLGYPRERVRLLLSQISEVLRDKGGPKPG